MIATESNPFTAHATGNKQAFILFPAEHDRLPVV